MDKSLLRKSAIQSLVLMLAVISISFAKGQYQPVPIQAVSQTLTLADAQVPVPLSEVTKGASQSSSELTAVGKLMRNTDAELTTQLGANYLVIDKTNTGDMTMKLEDLYIKKSIRLTLDGLTEDELDSAGIYRVRGNEIFTGDPIYTETVTKEINEEDGTTEKVVTKDYGKDPCHNISIQMKKSNQSGQYEAEVLLELDTVYAYQVYEDENHFYISLKKPSDVYDKILVIDAGHGGKDGGALSNDNEYCEKNLNLEILLELKKLLNQENIRVYYTRTEDETVFLRPRVELANAVDCDYFISIHCNANELAYPNGSEVLYYDKQVKGVSNKQLAKLLLSELDKKVSLTNAGIEKHHNGDIYIMSKAKVPMVLIEVGYVTNYGDLHYLLQEKNRAAVARGIFNGIMKAYQELPVNNND